MGSVPSEHPVGLTPAPQVSFPGDRRQGTRTQGVSCGCSADQDLPGDKGGGTEQGATLHARAISTQPQLTHGQVTRVQTKSRGRALYPTMVTLWVQIAWQWA